MSHYKRQELIETPARHLDPGWVKDWIAVDVAGETVVINEAGEGSVTAYTLDGTTRNPRVVATADAILWDGIVGLTHYEDGVVTISHRFGGIEDRIVVGEWLDEPAQTLERTEMVELESIR
jgi:hypothetical protein